ncbi:MAG: hypothetical protein JNN07_08000 [Verrucomicrobiales bacterium]|nr:hypothetical protein [Verrucomicrobiales bacterium]
MKATLALITFLCAASCNAAEIRWTAAQSPINLAKTFEIPPNDTLIIEAGVVVNSSSQFLVPYENSKVVIVGTEHKPVVFIGGGIDAYRSGNQILVRYLIMTNGWIQSGRDAARFEAYDCTFQATAFSTRGKTNILMRNRFLGQVNWDIGNTTLVNNLFTFPPGAPPETVMFNWPPATSLIRYNSFLVGNMTVIRSGTFDISLNYWTTTNSQVIEDRIIDRNDTFNSPGYVTFTPFLTAPDPETPTLPDQPAPPKAPVLDVKKSITIEFTSEPLIFYAIEGSNDTKVWNVLLGQILGDGGRISRSLEAEGSFLFYRIRASREP